MKKYAPLILIILFVITIKIILFSQIYHLVTWDEATFLGMGKWIFTSGESGLFEEIRPPGLPIILGLGHSFQNYVLWGDFVILLFTIGAIALTYLIANKLFGCRTAIVASLLTFITPVFFYNSNRIMTGIPSLFFCLLALYLYLKKSYILSATACAFAFLFRFPAGIIYPAIALIMLYEYILDKDINKTYKNLKTNINPFLGFNLTFLILLGLYLISNHLIYGSFIEPLIMASNHQSTFAGDIKGWGYILFYPAVLLSSNLLLIFALFTAKNKKNIYPLLPLILFFLYFTIIPHKKERFLILFLPYVSIFAAAGFYRVLSFTTDRYFHMTIYFILILILIPTLTNTYMTNRNFPEEKPEFIDTYFTYIQDELESPILTSDPVPAAYTDKKFIHFYDNTELGLKILTENIDNANAIIYNPKAFPWNSTTAEKQKKNMRELLQNKSAFKKDVSVWDGVREIYVLE